MKKTHIALAAALFILSAGASSARADAFGGGDISGLGVALAVGAGAVNLTFTIYDVAAASQGNAGNKGIALAELVIVGPEATGWMILAADGEHDAFTIGAAIWCDLLVVHSIYALATPRREVAKLPLTLVVPGRHRGESTTVSLVPAVVSDGRASASGLGLVGRF